jgi:hypothetical protein
MKKKTERIKKRKDHFKLGKSIPLAPGAYKEKNSKFLQMDSFK